MDKQEVIMQTMELVEKLSNSRKDTVVLPDGREFYQGESHILVLLRQEPGIYNSEIARRFLVTRAVVHKTLKKLISLGYIEKRKAENNEKNVCLFLTPSGEEAAEQLIKNHQKIMETFFSMVSEMSDSECEVVADFLRNANHILEKWR